MTPRTSGTDRKATRRKAAARPTKTRSAKPRPAARENTAPAKVGTARTAAAKRRTSPADVDVDGEVLEFIDALDRFKKQHHKPFPSWSEVLHVLRGLGYRKAR